MKDPFADVRERSEGDYKPESGVMAGYGLQVAAQDVNRLLSDADALLAVVRDQLEEASGVYENVPFDDLSNPLESWDGFLSRRYPALAALPERLK